MKGNRLKQPKPGQTEAQAEGLSGPVKQVMITTYKAHQKAGVVSQGKIERDYTFHRTNIITTFDEKGARVQEQLYGIDGRYVNTHHNGSPMPVESLHYYVGDTLYQKTTHTFNDKGGVLETLSLTGAGDIQYRAVNTYTEEGKQLEGKTLYGNEQRLHERTAFTYDDKGNMLSNIRYAGDGSIINQSHMKYNDRGQRIEYTTENTDKKNKFAQNARHTYKYNEHGDCIETNVYNLDGTLKNTYYSTHEYDSEGKKILPQVQPYDPDAKAAGETEECVNDAHGNWIKKTTFYNKIPVNIIVRQISYYGEPSADAPQFVHPLTNTTDVEDAKEAPAEVTELTEEQAQWLVEGPTTSADNFSFLRYYALQYKEAPSVVIYTGPYIEAIALLKELKENMGAQQIHSYSSVWNNRGEQLSRYTLSFPTFGYLLHCNGISTHDDEEYEVPKNISEHLDYVQYVSTSQFQLLRPSEASGRRDEDFEEELEKYINLCTLTKKPDKPVINMIEVAGNSFTMVEHAVDDDFEIKDLDINYGHGFEKFHNELMQRFISGTKGLVLFHGQPGTGKTYYIRHLLRKMVSNKKVVIYMPPNMVDHLVEPAFMTFLSGEVQDWSNDGNFCVLLIEDAEPLLAKRQEGVRIQGVTNLLNMTDGLLNDMLNLQIICTFNVDLKKLDSALLRPGRLVARKEFKPLGELDANLLAQRLGIKHHFTRPATLGEIYAMRKNKNTLIHDVEPDKGASTSIDDLLGDIH